MQILQLFDRVFFSRKFDEWAEEQTLLWAMVLNQAAADILQSVEPSLEDAGISDGWNTGRWIRQHVAPLTRGVLEQFGKDAIEDANRSLQDLVDLKLSWSRRIATEPDDRSTYEGVGDLASSLVPLGLAAATAASLPYIAVSTATYMFGLATVTTVSWPVVAAGAGVAALGVGTGVLEASKLRQKARARLRKKSREYIFQALIKGSEKQPALLEILDSEFAKAAQKAKKL